MFEKSINLFARAQQSIPGGVNSPVRAFKSVGGTPVFMKSAKGAYMFDADGNRFIDYINSWGPMILGHAYEPVVKAIQEYAQYSTSFGAPTELEIEMAEKELQELGITAVPLFIIDDKFGISGAQSVEAFMKAFEEAALVNRERESSDVSRE